MASGSTKGGSGSKIRTSTAASRRRQRKWQESMRNQGKLPF